MSITFCPGRICSGPYSKCRCWTPVRSVVGGPVVVAVVPDVTFTCAAGVAPEGGGHEGGTERGHDHAGDRQAPQRGGTHLHQRSNGRPPVRVHLASLVTICSNTALCSTTTTSRAAGELRAAWRAEEAAWSRAALERWEHDRSLADVVARLHAPWRHRRVDLGCTAFTGAVAIGGRRHRAHRTADGAVDVRLVADAPVVVRVVESARRGGSRGDTTVTTFAARLRQLDGALVRLGLRTPRASSTASCSWGVTRCSVRRPRRSARLRADRVGLLGAPASTSTDRRPGARPATPGARRAGSASPVRLGSGGRGSGPRGPSGAGTRRGPAGARRPWPW